MPGLPPNLTAPYDSIEFVLNGARVAINGAASANGLAGSLLTDTAVFTQPLLSLAWRDMQDELQDNGFETLKKECVLLGMRPATSTTDPSTQCSLSWTGYFDGLNTWTPPNTPVLPQDMIEPVRLWERQNGSNGRFMPMAPANDGLPSRPPGGAIRVWEWRNDAIWMLGCTVSYDLRIRYDSYLADLVVSASAITNAATPVPIMRSGRALALYLAAEFAASRGSILADNLYTKGDEAVGKLCLRTSRKKQRGQHRRRPYGGSMTNRGTWNW